MQGLIDAIMGIFRALFGGGNGDSGGTTSPPGGAGGDGSGTADEQTCELGQFDIPSDQPEPDVPYFETTGALQAFEAQSAGGVMTASAQAVTCTATIKSSLGEVNVRSGPRLSFSTEVKARGGVTFELVGASEADEDGFRWFQLKIGQRTGWIRSDLLEVSPDCLRLSYITEDDITPEAPPAPDGVFPRPSDAIITQGYHSGHKGIDLGTSMRTPIRAATDGVIIRAVNCVNCSDARPNIFPCGSSIYRSEAWGYGYGNFCVIRHDYAVVPPPLRAQMDRLNLTGGFVYVLYAHFSRLNVRLGEQVSGGHVLGLTGNHGCSTGPHLHFEVRVGNVEIVDGKWLQQRALNPNLMFDF